MRMVRPRARQVPPHWLDGLSEAVDRGGANPDPAIPKLRIIGTGFEEPECPNGWCGLQHKTYSAAARQRTKAAGEAEVMAEEQKQDQEEPATPPPTAPSSAGSTTDGTPQETEAAQLQMPRKRLGDLWKKRLRGA